MVRRREIARCFIQVIALHFASAIAGGPLHLERNDTVIPPADVRRR